MTYRLLIKTEAILDMTEAFAWYENKRTGLGTDFLNEVEDFFERIVQNPEHYRSHKELRIAIMHRFPYKVVFGIEGEAIVV